MSALQSLHKLLDKYKSLGTDRKGALDRLQMGIEKMQDIREKIIMHTFV